MRSLLAEIENANAYEMEDVLHAVLHRCSELYPEREIGLLSLSKSPERDEQLDRTIEFLQNLKTSS